ncbi:hypothetical protein [Aureimonas glaciei]|uniref:PepSY domain-containing protein n=1 Tax=Aureimonas glaciei TaxID=1776957 RepID=A0A916Y904_9HYPH|nr:hypothetical protein [Aureimonas glaciei]GGD34793.1 hypothetical protein GCM10011335_42300 [Aureimonas glaciei]
MRKSVLLGVSTCIAGAMLQKTSAQVDDSMIAKPPSLEAYYWAKERLTVQGYRSIRVARRQPPTVTAVNRAGDEVEVTIDQFDGRILSIRHPKNDLKNIFVLNRPSVRPR